MPSALTKAEKKAIIEARDDAREVKQAVVGIPGTEDTGLVGQVKAVCERQDTQEERHNKLSTRFWLLVGILSGTGVLSGGIWGLLQL